jgi:hypothetical protein
MIDISNEDLNRFDGEVIQRVKEAMDEKFVQN